MSEDTRKVLDMLSQGKVSVIEAEQLLQAALAVQMLIYSLRLLEILHWPA